MRDDFIPVCSEFFGCFSGINFFNTLIGVEGYDLPLYNPYRGPIIYQNGQHKYHCIVNGEFEWFQGYEKIIVKNEETLILYAK